MGLKNITLVAIRRFTPSAAPPASHCCPISAVEVGSPAQRRLSLPIRAEVPRVIILHLLVWEFVDRTDKALSAEIAQKMQEFTLLARAVDEDLTLDAAQEQANQEALTYAQMLVDNGYGTWKIDMDPDRARALLEKWQADKNAVRVAKMFGKQKLSLL